MLNSEKNFQRLLLNMLSWFHNFCVENNLRYYMIGGTMLGAVRHKGFIPWDDDIDVAMPRKDYERFIELAKNAKNDRYVIESAQEDNLEYQYLYAKIYDTRTTLVENTRSKARRGVYIDVFPLDGIGNTNDEAKQNVKSIHNLIKFHLIITCDFRRGRKWHKSLAIVLGRLITPTFVKERRINNKINNLCKKYDFDESLYVGNICGNWWEKEIMPAKYFGTPKLYDFEEIKVFGVESPAEYLTSLYGDFMRLPPKEKRKSHHDFVSCDLNKPYLEEGR